MAGIMVQSLVSRGVPFDVALETANQVRERLARRRKVPAAELSKLVHELLGDRSDLEAPLRREDVPTPLVRNVRGSASPFSKGMMAISLQGAGMDTSDAWDVSRELEAWLLRDGRREIGRIELRDVVAETIERTHGASAAQRYRVWRRAREDPRPIFILIGGSTGVGKTSIAVEVARRLEISRVIGTDSIRQIMRLMFSPDLMPEIHCSTYDAYKALGLGPEGSPDAVIAGFREQAQKIAVGVNALLDRAVEENTSMLIEGVNQLPSLLDLDRYREHAHVISMIVATLDPDAYRDRFHTRADAARERSADRYLDHFEEIGVIQDFILGEADRFGLPIIDNVRFDDAVLSATRSVLATLKKSMPAPDSEAK
jgi:2-phosphoglycerate kinase